MPSGPSFNSNVKPGERGSVSSVQTRQTQDSGAVTQNCGNSALTHQGEELKGKRKRSVDDIGKKAGSESDSEGNTGKKDGSGEDSEEDKGESAESGEEQSPEDEVDDAVDLMAKRLEQAMAAMGLKGPLQGGKLQALLRDVARGGQGEKGGEGSK